jgi:hypothetical protein
MLLLLSVLALSTPQGIDIGPQPSQLIESCKEVPLHNGLSQNAQICMVFIAGIVDGQRYLAPDKFPYCFPPNNASIGQMAEAVVKFGEAHPEIDSSAALVTNALRARFPCRVKP